MEACTQSTARTIADFRFQISDLHCRLGIWVFRSRVVGNLQLSIRMVENPPITVEKIRVRYGETDQMGHAYYANYLYWFEQARGAWRRARGFSHRDMEAMGYFLPVVEAHAEYRGEVLFDDVITV